MTHGRARKTTREAAVNELARRFRNWVETFESARSKNEG